MRGSWNWRMCKVVGWLKNCKSVGRTVDEVETLRDVFGRGERRQGKRTDASIYHEIYLGHVEAYILSDIARALRSFGRDHLFPPPMYIFRIVAQRTGPLPLTLTSLFPIAGSRITEISVFRIRIFCPYSAIGRLPFLHCPAAPSTLLSFTPIPIGQMKRFFAAWSFFF